MGWVHALLPVPAISVHFLRMMDAVVMKKTRWTRLDGASFLELR